MAEIIKRIISMVLAFNILLLPELSSAWQRKVIIITDPPGATIYVDGEKVGKSPCDVRLEQGLFKGKDYIIKAEKIGYKVAFKTIKPSKIKIFGLVGGVFGVLPFILPFGFAFNKDNSPDKIFIKLEPANKAVSKGGH
ncbi:MAG: PEGA domain-containing protein [Nitrospirota bacterium]